MTTQELSGSLCHPVSSNGRHNHECLPTLLSIGGGSSHTRRTTANNDSAAPRSTDSLTIESTKQTSQFAAVIPMRKKTMWHRKSVTNRKTRLEGETCVVQQIREQRNTRVAIDFSDHPVPLTRHADAASSSPAQPLTWRPSPAAQPVVSRQLQHLIDDLYRQDPQAASQLSNARTQEEFLSAVCGLCNLSRALSFCQQPPLNRAGLAERMTHYLNRNLHTGPTLKTLAQFLGYSEKYCSDLFRSTMGESFSRYLKRRKTERAITLLTTTDKSVSDIAAILGFSDPFTFSHFFKRATGQSPRAFRTTQTRPPAYRATCPPSRRCSPL